MEVRLVSKTQPVIEGLETLEDIIVYAARVSNPNNQMNTETGEKLLGYCWRHKHWSIFETGTITMEIKTSRAISAQILRHRSFTFQEYSQRYSKSTEFEPVELRRQDDKNRQNSIADMSEEDMKKANEIVDNAINTSQEAYEKLLEMGVAKECARAILPLTTQTTMYMTGNMRSWITYCTTRCEKGTQKEHRDVADAVWRVVREECPAIAKFVEEEYDYLKDIK